MFWFIYNIGLPMYPVNRFIAKSNPFTGLAVFVGLLSIAAVDDDNYDILEGVIGFHMSMLVNIWRHRSNYIDFLEVDEDVHTLERQFSSSEEN